MCPHSISNSALVHRTRLSQIVANQTNNLNVVRSIVHKHHRFTVLVPIFSGSLWFVIGYQNSLFCFCKLICTKFSGIYYLFDLTILQNLNWRLMKSTENPTNVHVCLFPLIYLSSPPKASRHHARTYLTHFLDSYESGQPLYIIPHEGNALWTLTRLFQMKVAVVANSQPFPIALKVTFTPKNRIQDIK